MFERIRAFFRDSPRMWVIIGIGVLAMIVVVWGVYGDFSLQFSSFFAATPPTASLSVSPSTTTPGGTVDVSWSSTDTTTCTTIAGNFSTGGATSGTATQTIAPAFTGTSVQLRISCTGPGGTVQSNVATITVTQSGGGGGGAGGAVPVDPTGNCVWKTNFNAPSGDWFCKSLQCNLDGNPDATGNHPPEGPATQLNVHIYGTTPETVDPAVGPINIRTVLDATPKCGDGKECYPPKDPLWTCTAAAGVMNQGRNGSDFYSCYDPIIHRTNYGPITCCAGTGLPGDCFTWNLAAPSTSPTTSPTGAPTTSPIASPTTSPTVSPTASPTISSTVSPSVSPTGTPAPLTLTLAVGGANLSTGAPEAGTVDAAGGQQVSVIAVISNPQAAGTQGLTNVMVRATLPAGVGYVADSTTVDGIAAPEGIVGTGVNIGSIAPAQFHRVAFRTLIDGSAFPAGTTNAIVFVSASADNAPQNNGQMTIVVTKGVVAPVAVKTGPGDAVLAAFLVSAIMTLLYVSYTHTSVFRRHELEKLGRDQGPLDFRS